MRSDLYFRLILLAQQELEGERLGQKPAAVLAVRKER